MKKYLFIFKSEIMSSLQYLFNTITGFIGYLLMIFIFINLWQFIYSDPSEIINGYTMNQMIWYVIITEILWGTLNGKKFVVRISNDIKSGNIAYVINKPYNYILYLLFSNLGSIAIKFIVYIMIAFGIGFIFVGSFPALNIFQLVFIFIIGILALIGNILIMIMIGLFSFTIEDSGPFYWLYSKIILVLGTIFPIEYFPVFFQSILKYSPVLALCYGPAKLFVDFSNHFATEVLIAQIIYIVIVYLFCLLIYRKGVKKLNVNGG